MLRDYQQRILTATSKAVSTGSRRPVIVAPPGSGKTHIAAEMAAGARRKGKKVLVLAPRRELIYQMANTLSEYSISAGIIMAGEPLNSYARIQVASFDTLHARGVKRRKIEMPDADLVIVDEAHLSMAKTRLNILNHYSNSVIAGFTATPARSDGCGLGEFYDDMIHEVSYRELIKNGHLVEAQYYAPTTFDLTGVKETKSDYVLKDLARAVDKSVLIGDITQNWNRLASDKRTVVYCVSCAHSRHVRDDFLKMGVVAEHLDGNTDPVERREILRRVLTGETQVLTNVYVASYGLDIPPLECCVLARPTKDLSLYHQTGGRVFRTSPGKSDCMIIDHVGAVARHGFIEDLVPWSLEGKDVRDEREKANIEKKAAKEMTCGACGFVYKASRECPKCHHQSIPRTESIPHYEAKLKKVKKENLTPEKTQSEKTSFYAQLMEFGNESGYSTGWAKQQYKSKFKEWPSCDPTPEKTGKEVLGWIKHQRIAYAYRKKQTAQPELTQ